MLDEHFVDGFDADIGIERCAAEFHKFVELSLKLGVIAVRGFDFVFERGGDFTDLLAIALDGFVEIVE